MENQDSELGGTGGGWPDAPACSRRTALAALAGGALGLLAGCAPSVGSSPAEPGAGTTGAAPGPPPSEPPAPAAAGAPGDVAGRATVPVLCYHQVRPWQSGDSEYTRSVLVCPPERFRAQLDGLAEAGYTTIGPAQYLAHLTAGAALPDKPVLLSFDDGKDNQPTTALPEVLRRGMTATFYVMSVVLDKPGWVSSRQVRALADQGITIGSHTYDHQALSKLPDTDWATQLEKPRETLRRLSGQEVETLAYPYGSWAPRSLPHVAAAGYTTAFQLADQPLDPAHPLLTLRRRLVASAWTGPQLVERLRGAGG